MHMKIACLLLLATFARAQDSCLITFNSDVPVYYGTESITSVDCADVIFSGDTTDGGEGVLYLADFDYLGRSGQSLAVLNNDHSALRMTFQKPATYLELWFGNDAPYYMSESDLAVLSVFSGDVEVGRTEVNVNADFVSNQLASISVTTLANVRSFDSARFQYTDSSGFPIDSVEVVDDISVTFDIFLVKCPCKSSWRNHGAYVSCISKLAAALKKDGALSSEARNKIVSESAKSKCGM